MIGAFSAHKFKCFTTVLPYLTFNCKPGLAEESLTERKAGILL